MTPMKNITVTKEDTAFLDDLKEMLKKHQHLDPMHMLAISAQFTGMLLALQDQRKMSAQMGIELIWVNVEAGNQEAIKASFANTHPTSN